MSNSIGVMDSGYRGNFKVPIDNLSDEDFVIENTHDYFKLHPILDNIQLEIVNI